MHIFQQSTASIIRKESGNETAETRRDTEDSTMHYSLPTRAFGQASRGHANKPKMKDTDRNEIEQIRRSRQLTTQPLLLVPTVVVRDVGPLLAM